MLTQKALYYSFTFCLIQILSSIVYLPIETILSQNVLDRFQAKDFLPSVFNRETSRFKFVNIL